MANGGLNSDFYLGIDQGGSSTKAVILDQNGQVIWSDLIEIQTLHGAGPTDIIFEHDSIEVLNSVSNLIKRAKQEVGAERIRALGFSIQRSGVLAWEAQTGNDNGKFKSLSNIRTWRDARNKVAIEKLRSSEDLIKSTSGLPLTYHFAALKIAEFQKDFPKAEVGTIDTWLLANLLSDNPYITEEGHAARSQLYSLKTRSWDSNLCKLFGVNASRLAQIKPSLSGFGSIHDIPLAAVLGDQQAALFGLNVDDPVLNLGTVGQIILSQGETFSLAKGYNTGVTYTTNKEVHYQIEASINCCGLILDQVREILNLNGIKNISDDPCEKLGVIFNASMNSGSPDWISDLPEISEGITRGTVEHAQALLENVAFWISLNFRTLKKLGYIKNTLVYALGGGSQSDYLMQVLADAMGAEIRKVKNVQGSAYGAAAAAYLSVNKERLNSGLSSKFDSFSPNPSNINIRQNRWLEIYQANKNSLKSIK